MAESDYYIQDNADIETQKLNAAKGLYQAGDYNGALRLYLDMINTSASHKLYYEIGKCYYKLNDFTTSELYFTNSISLEEEKNPSYMYLGNIFYKNNNTENAIENWIKYFSFKPNDEIVCLNLASSYFSKNMKFDSVYYYQKYLRYAKDKTSQVYLEIKKSIDEFNTIGQDFYKKAQRAVSMKDNETAIQALEYAVNNMPSNYDINFLLGNLYLEEKDFESAIKYLKQALCIDFRSIDVLQSLSSALIYQGDILGAYCCLKRILPLVMNNQKKYLDITRTIKGFDDRFETFNSDSRLALAESYYNNNEYRLALFEYENCVLLEPVKMDELKRTINKIKSYINPEERIIKACFEKGMYYHSAGDYKEANKYFSRIMGLSNSDSQDYKLAKARIKYA